MAGEKSNSIGVIHAQQILKLLPHRYPMLLIDRILELDPEKTIISLKNVTINEPFFTGHFPGNPVMPGVLQIEAMAQTAAILMYAEQEKTLRSDQIFLFTAIDNARFKRMVEPGDQLIIRVDFIRSKAGLYKFKGVAMVDDEVASTAELMCTVKNAQ
jgi:3-hydroxyacyl-[acyl-carrier-protein] dehydratase